MNQVKPTIIVQSSIMVLKRRKNLRKFKVPNLVDPNAWYAKMEDLGNGWWRSDWFGAFSVHVNGWIYHADLGWAYAVGMIRKGFGYGPERGGYGQAKRVGLIYGSMKRLIGFIS